MDGGANHFHTQQLQADSSAGDDRAREVEWLMVKWDMVGWRMFCKKNSDAHPLKISSTRLFDPKPSTEGQPKPLNYTNNPIDFITRIRNSTRRPSRRAMPSALRGSTIATS